MSEIQNVTTPDFFGWITALKAKIQKARNKHASEDVFPQTEQRYNEIEN